MTSSVISLISMFLFTATLASVVSGQATRERTTKDCSIDSRGVHKCLEDAPLDGTLDPRAETFFKTKIPVSERSFQYKFKANFFISSAKRTTIFQFLNQDLTQSDRYKPVLFIVAWKVSDERLKICMFESCKHVWEDVPHGFRLEVIASGREALVKIAGSSKTFNLVRPLNGAYRPEGSHEVRWGVYHHDISEGKAASEARSRVYNIEAEGF